LSHKWLEKQLMPKEEKNIQQLFSWLHIGTEGQLDNPRLFYLDIFSGK
jgi:hypothetical protein